MPPQQQEHDVYRSGEFRYQLLFSFDKAGRLLKQTCAKGACDEVASIEYGPDGPLHTLYKNVHTRDTYQDGNLASSTSRAENATSDLQVRRYVDYKVDACGNWVERRVIEWNAIDRSEQEYGTELRKIDYFTPCAPATPPAAPKA